MYLVLNEGLPTCHGNKFNLLSGFVYSDNSGRLLEMLVAAGAGRVG